MLLLILTMAGCSFIASTQSLPGKMDSLKEEMKSTTEGILANTRAIEGTTGAVLENTLVVGGTTSHMDDNARAIEGSLEAVLANTRAVNEATVDVDDNISAMRRSIEAVLASTRAVNETKIHMGDNVEAIQGTTGAVLANNLAVSGATQEMKNMNQSMLKMIVRMDDAMEKVDQIPLLEHPRLYLIGGVMLWGVITFLAVWMGIFVGTRSLRRGALVPPVGA